MGTLGGGHAGVTGLLQTNNYRLNHGVTGLLQTYNYKLNHGVSVTLQKVCFTGILNTAHKITVKTKKIMFLELDRHSGNKTVLQCPSEYFTYSAGPVSPISTA